MRLNYINDADPIDCENFQYLNGISITPQVETGKYIVNFKVQYFKNYHHAKDGKNSGTYNSLLIECDVKEWHERSNKEREYEKERDRYLVSEGHEVFHYTAKEILRTPTLVAAKIIARLTGENQENLFTDASFLGE